ncbi:MAG: type III pantothenate kinase [Herpetosiphon sp.]
MLLACDIGNTNIKLGLFEAGELRHYWRLSTERHRLADEYAVVVLNLLAQSGVALNQISGCAISCVVPPLTMVFASVARTYLHVEALIIGPGVKTGMRLLVDTPREVGADRVANSVAAFRRYGGPTISIAFGTATAFDVISADGDYVGGAIAPGVGIASDALFRAAAKLYQVELVSPPRAIGKNTSQALQSGIVLGYAGLVEGLVQRINRELEKPAVVVATGGMAEVIADVIARETQVIDHVVPYLTLEGVRLIHELNAHL